MSTTTLLRSLSTTSPSLYRTFSATTSAAKSVNTKDMVNVIADAHDMSQAEARRILTTVTDTIVDTVRKKESVSIAGFGAFSARTSKAYTARVPVTNEPVEVPEKQRVKFKAFKSFADIVNGEK